jgi:predicted nuclease of predicted toxin-antitoxin system
MNFLFDQSADFRLIPYLQHLGHDVTAVSHEYPSGLDDNHILAIARREGRILITTDLDFGEMVVRLALPHAGLILLRLPGATLQTKIDRLATALRDHAQDLAECRLLVVTSRRIRIR